MRKNVAIQLFGQAVVLQNDIERLIPGDVVEDQGGPVPRTEGSSTTLSPLIS